MRTFVFIFALVLSSSALAQDYTDGRGNTVVPDAQTQRAINEAKALRGQYYTDRYDRDGVTLMRDGTVYHFNRNGITRRGDLDYRRNASDELKSVCGGLRPRKQERCIRDYREEQQKLKEKYQD